MIKAYPFLVLCRPASNTGEYRAIAGPNLPAVRDMHELAGGELTGLDHARYRYSSIDGQEHILFWRVLEASPAFLGMSEKGPLRVHSRPVRRTEGLCIPESLASTRLRIEHLQKVHDVLLSAGDRIYRDWWTKDGAVEWIGLDTLYIDTSHDADNSAWLERKPDKPWDTTWREH